MAYENDDMDMAYQRDDMTIAYEKPVVTRLGSLAEMTLWKQWGGTDWFGDITGLPIGNTS